MAFSLEQSADIYEVVAAYIKEKRPPEEIREEVDLAYRIDNQSVIIYEVRADWKDRSRKIEERVAKATFVKSKECWKIYWQRADLRWHRYEPKSEVKRIDDFIKIVEEDQYGCFWG
jgi:hypothetical protein